MPKMGLEAIMAHFAELGAVMILKVDGEREANEGRWTFMAAGGPLATRGPIRFDAHSLDECLRLGLTRVHASGDQWDWLDEVLKQVPLIR